jgi:dihydrofolate synthase/folylpolyglutamate synthase
MNDVVSWLISTYGQENMRPGLDRITSALQDLVPELKKSRIITIAGTNGKGETTLRLSELLKDRPHLVWTSPHIERITERFRDQKGEISLAELKKLIEVCHNRVQSENFELSFYEFLFFVFCTWAAEKTPEFLLLEVGLGGRFDAVNVLEAELVLLPSISRDHQEFLGKRYDQILQEKIALVRPGKKLLSYVDSNYLRERTIQTMQKRGAQVVDLESFGIFPSYEFSRRNELLAYAAFLSLNGEEVTAKKFKNWSPQGHFLEHRGEVLSLKRDWIFFGSHNPDGLRKLIQFLHSANYNFPRPPYATIIVAFSRRETSDLRAMLKMLKNSHLGEVVITSFDHPKAASQTVIEKLSHEEGLEFAPSFEEYVQGTNNGPVLVTGSYYFLGSFKSFLRRGRAPTSVR